MVGSVNLPFPPSILISDIIRKLWTRAFYVPLACRVVARRCGLLHGPPSFHYGAAVLDLRQAGSEDWWSRGESNP